MPGTLSRGWARKQLSSGAKAVLYAALGVSAALVAVGSGSSTSGESYRMRDARQHRKEAPIAH